MNLNPLTKSRVFGQDFNVLRLPDFCQLCSFFFIRPYINFREGGNPAHLRILNAVIKAFYVLVPENFQLTFTLHSMLKLKNKPMAPKILERGLPICGLRPNNVCE
jgi:hypothetical protein